jgi:3-oxoacyl-(acyl-carrier-protein) synthase
VSRVFVTGIGVISAIGNMVSDNHAALVAGQCGIRISDRFPSKYSGTLPFGEIALTTAELKQLLHVHDADVTRTTLLAMHAFNEAVEDAGLTATQLSSSDSALIGGTTVGGMCLTDELYRDANEENNNSHFLSSYDCASVFMFMQRYFKIGGLVNTINTACSSSANSIMYGARLLKNGLAKRAVVGGTDSLSKFTINGFNSLHILSPDVCKPFDAQRTGLNLAEGAAFLVMEKEEDIAGKKVYAEVTGYGNTNDAFHPSSLSTDGDGPLLAMQQALASAKLNSSDISFINAHGTGTENNDEAESRAMVHVFGTPPPFTSTKSNIGHTLGASGAIEAIYSILNLTHQEIYPSLHFKQAIADTGLKPEQAYRKAALKHVMSNSFGFGGNCTSLIFSKP